MTRRLKIGSVALTAAFALTLFAAAAAHAVPGKITGPQYPLWLTGEVDPETVLKITIGKEVRVISCLGTKTEVTITAATAAPAFKPTFSSCTSAPGSLGVDINAHECTFTATVPDASKSELTTAIENCPSTAPLEFTLTASGGTTLCAYKMENQSGLAGSTWLNKEGPLSDVTVVVNISPTITVTTGTAIACGAAVGGHPTMVYQESTTVKGYKDEGPMGIEGEQVGIMFGQ